MEYLRKKVSGEVIAIDGNSMPRKASMPHIVLAWAIENGICHGQVKPSEKSNEITAISELVKAILTEGCTITIDAMRCQKANTEIIIENKAYYIFAVKEIQGNLERTIENIVPLLFHRLIIQRCY